MESKLNDFEILNKLGEGSFGTVFKVRRKADKGVYVMKQINISKMNQRLKNEALNEATILAKLDSQFIVRYFESFIDRNLLCIIMELCEGGDLHKYLKMQMGRPLNESQVWRLLIQTALGLAYLHKHKILHRDIKAMNIFMTKDSIRIGDLGVAKLLSDQNNFAKTMVGTPYYLSPEMCEEKPYNEKSDIWALGCVIYELCTFKHPFEAQNQGALVLKIIRGRYEAIPNCYSSGLTQLIDLCLQKDYRSRPDAFQLLQHLSLLQQAQTLRIPLHLNQPHPNTKPAQPTASTVPVVKTKDIVPPTPTPVSSKAVVTPMAMKKQPQPIQFEVKGKQEPIKTPVAIKKEPSKIVPPQSARPKDIQVYKDWSDKVSELQKPVIKQKTEPMQVIVQQPVQPSQPVKPTQPVKSTQPPVAITPPPQTAPSKKPTVTKKGNEDKKRVRKGAPTELARQAQQPVKRMTEQGEAQLQLLKSKKNTKVSTCSAEEVEQVLNLPEIMVKPMEEVMKPRKDLIDLAQFLMDEEKDTDIPTTELHSIEQYQQEESEEQDSELIQFNEDEDDEEQTPVEMDDVNQNNSDMEEYYEEANDTVDYEQEMDQQNHNQNQDQEQEQLLQNNFETIKEEQFEDTQHYVELVLDNKKLEINKKILDAERRRIELQQIMDAKNKECIRDLGVKLFNEIISFFRTKLNAEDELNDADQDEIDQVVQTKLLNTKNPQIIYTLYKILHFEIEITKCDDKIKENHELLLQL